jgi:hypothetical protein
MRFHFPAQLQNRYLGHILKFSLFFFFFFFALEKTIIKHLRWVRLLHFVLIYFKFLPILSFFVLSYTHITPKVGAMLYFDVLFILYKRKELSS